MNAGHEGLACWECRRPVLGATGQFRRLPLAGPPEVRPSASGPRTSTARSAWNATGARTTGIPPPASWNRALLSSGSTSRCARASRATRSTTGCGSRKPDWLLHPTATKAPRSRTIPISPRHEELVTREPWNACLQCRDFHGNHVWITPVSLHAGVPEPQIWSYFAGALAPGTTSTWSRPGPGWAAGREDGRRGHGRRHRPRGPHCRERPSPDGTMTDGAPAGLTHVVFAVLETENDAVGELWARRIVGAGQECGLQFDKDRHDEGLAGPPGAVPPGDGREPLEGS